MTQKAWLAICVLVWAHILGTESRKECFSWTPIEQRIIEDSCNGLLIEQQPETLYKKFNFYKNNLAVNWTVLDPVAGEVEVEFQFVEPGLNYTLSLAVSSEPTSEEKCPNENLTKVMHSTRYFHTYNCSAEGPSTTNCTVTCGMTGKVRFQHVFSNCYVVEIKVFEEDPDLPQMLFETHWQYLRTEYVKLKLHDLRPVISPIVQPARKAVSVYYNQQEALCTRRELELSYFAYPYTVLCTLVLDPSTPLENVQCRTGEYNLKPSCTVIEGAIQCTFHNVSAGNYCLSVEVKDDDRCEPSTTFLEPGLSCKWTTSFIMPEIPKCTDDRCVEKRDHWPYILASIVAVILTVSALSVYALCICIKRMYVQASLPCDNPEHLYMSPPLADDARQKVLLLYTYDCKPFMQLMVTFRRLLEKVALCEVYDCFDTKYFEKISQNPADWVRRLVSSDDVKVVVVSSACAAVRQKAHLNGIHTGYRDPTCFDSLFLYGLQSITDQIEIHSYQKYFVVRFDGFTEEKDLLNYLTPHRRYILPRHLCELVHHLNDRFQFVEGKLDCYPEMENLKEDLNTLVRYKKENEDYLKHLLTFN